MGKTIRFGVSLNSDLLERFDELAERKGYKARSEAIRDLIRDTLVKEQWEAQGEVAGTLTLVYDHHHSDLSQRLTELQHDHHDVILSSMHVHLDHDNCLEVIALKGQSASVRALGDKLAATKGVKHGKLVLTTTGQGIV